MRFPTALPCRACRRLSLLCLAFGCAYGLHFTRLNPWAKKVFQIVILLPLFLPSITYGFAVIYSFGRLGLVSQIFGVLPFSIYGFWGLLIADVIYTLPPAFLILSNAFHYIDRNTITVSRLMGDSPCAPSTFRRCVRLWGHFVRLLF